MPSSQEGGAICVLGSISCSVWNDPYFPNSRVLVLDEAMSTVGSTTDGWVQDVMVDTARICGEVRVYGDHRRALVEYYIVVQ
mmetsp:Transcript_39160/g.47097  ORF Transcript_39160/g.47097 Transcript_39160/m.47097 type:complete len:82 (-) Transcript_39160:445-690(-)